MEYNVEDPARRPHRLRTVAILFVVAVLACGAVAAITILAGVTAALIAGIAFLWVGLLAAIKQARAEARRVDIFLDVAKDKYDSIIGVLCGSLYLKDDINVNHTSRVSRLASMVAEEMGMRRDEVRLLQKAAILADIGKIEIAQGIITKPGELNEQEWREMKRHPEYGYRILNSIVHLRDARDIVLSHHERFDGQGYPRGLKDEEIPLGARIFSVADAYCAMTSDRPHRKKMPHEMALKEILRNSLTQFDPEVVRAFVRCEERGLINQWHGVESTPPSMATGVPSPA